MLVRWAFFCKSEWVATWDDPANTQQLRPLDEVAFRPKAVLRGLGPIKYLIDQVGRHYYFFDEELRWRCDPMLDDSARLS